MNIMMIKRLDHLMNSSIMMTIVALCCGCYGDVGIQLSGVVVDIAGRPIPNAKIELAPSPASGCDETPSTTTTDKDGVYHCYILCPEEMKKFEVILKVSESGFAEYKETVY